MILIVLINLLDFIFCSIFFNWTYFLSLAFSLFEILILMLILILILIFTL